MIAPTAKSREQIEIFYHPLASFRGCRGWRRLSCEVQIKRASYVHPVSSGKQPERATDARVHVQNFVLPVAQIVAVSNVENSVIADRLHELGGCLLNRLITKRSEERRVG